jgi:hypothetical protein
LFLEFTALRCEKMDQRRITSDPIGKLYAVRGLTEQFLIIGRSVDGYDGRRGFYPGASAPAVCSNIRPFRTALAE